MIFSDNGRKGNSYSQKSGAVCDISRNNGLEFFLKNGKVFVSFPERNPHPLAVDDVQSQINQYDGKMVAGNVNSHSAAVIGNTLVDCGFSSTG